MNQLRTTSCSPERVALIQILCLLMFAIMLGGAVLRIAVQGDMLVSEAVKRYFDKTVMDGARGSILDRNGYPLAASGLTFAVYVNPILFTSWAKRKSAVFNAQTSAELAAALELDETQLEKILARDKGFAYLRKGISPESAELLRTQLQARGVKHVGFEAQQERYYPSAHETAHLIGFIDHTRKGIEGLEASLEDELASEEGFERFIRSQDGDVVEVIEEQLATDGIDINLTIDTRLQYLASSAMAYIVKKHEADSASLVLLDVHSGEIYALANVPTFNPNSREGKASSRRNRALQDVFEPGSTMKPIIAALAIDDDLVDPDTLLKTAKPLHIGRRTIKNDRIDTDLTLQEVIMRSSNVGAVRVADMLEDERMWQGYSDFGFGSGRLLDMPGETSGTLRDYKTWKPIEKATMSFGYGISTNLLQLARAYAIFGSDGYIVNPYLRTGNAATEPKRQRVVSPQTARAVISMMETVTSDKGTARRARIHGYRVAGKTGTSHKYVEELNGYDEESYLSYFVGLAPASAPRFVCAVMVNNPRRGGYYGGTVAAPVFARIMEHALRLYAVPPDALVEEDPT